KAELHIPQQSLAAGEQHRSICGGKSARFVDRTGAMIDKFTHWSSPRHHPRAGGDSFDNVVIAGASADVALEFFADCRLIRLTQPTHDVERHHYHARSAVAALKRVMLPKRGLHRMKRGIGGGEPLNCGDRCTFALEGEHGARLDRQTVDVHDACAALRRVATDVRSDKA